MHILDPLGTLTYLAAVVVSITLGFLAKPALLSIAIGGFLFTLGYFFVRAPQLLGLISSEKKSPISLFLFMSVFYCILSAPLYGLGRLFS